MSQIMSGCYHPECHESFLQNPSKVADLMQQLTLMATVDKSEDLKPKKKGPEPVVDYSAKVTDTNYLVTERNPNANTRMTKRSRTRIKVNCNQIVFMRQIGQTLEQRKEARRERVMIANRFRRLGNSEFRKGNYNEAIRMYTTGLNYITDTYVLYLNRAACYYKLRLYKRSIIDCDHILCKLDPRNLRAWLYRGIAFQRQGDESNYDYSIYKARLLNVSQSEFIDAFLEKMRVAS